MAAPDSPPTSPSPDMRSPRSDIASMAHHTIPYSAAFSDSVMRVVLQSPSSPSSGITVVAGSSTDTSLPRSSVHINDIDPLSLPDISHFELPVPLDDTRRIYTSLLPGANLTHPGGWIEGGKGPSDIAQSREASDEAAQRYLSQHRIETLEQLQEQISRDVMDNMEELRDRMMKREEAIKENEEVERKVEALIEQRKLERRIEERMRKEMRSRKDDGE